MTTPAQAAARRRFMESHAPMTDIPEVRRTYVDPDLVGRRLYHRRLGVILAYQYSFTSNVGVDDAIVHAGTVVKAAPGLGIAVGQPWAYWADRLSIIVARGEGHASHGGQEGRQPR